MTYYNTTNLEGDELSGAYQKAMTQDEKLLAFFSSRPGHTFTSWEIVYVLFYDKVPVTSVCRALDTLHKAGKVIQLRETRRSGPYDRKCHLWRLRTNSDSLLALLGFIA